MRRERRNERRGWPRRRRLGSVGYLGMLVGVVSATVYLNAGSALPATSQEPPPTTKPASTPTQEPFDPTVAIDVEQAVDFPWDM